MTYNPAIAVPAKGLTKEHRKVAAASFIGTAIEWYDYYLYGTCAALVFPYVFFPEFDPYVGTLVAFATYAVGFVARPIGGVVAGHYGDRIGRKAMLMLSLLVMGISTVLIGFIPSYASIGVWAAVILCALRILQGFAVGGEWGAAVVMAVEHAPPGKRGLYGSFPQIGVPAGLLLSTIAVAIASGAMTNEDFLSWGWRIPFLFSALLIIVGVYIRASVSESPAFEAVKESNQQAERPVVDVVREQWRVLLLTIGMKFLQNAVFYLYSVFMLSYIVNSLGFDRQVGLNAVVISSVVGFATLPFWSWLSDKVGRKPIYLFGCIASTLFIIPFFSLAQSGSIILLTVGVVIGLNVLHDSLYGPQAVYFSELYGTKVRLSGASIGYQIGAVLSGGLAPLIATALLAFYDGKPTGIIIYVFILGIISTGCTLLARETYKDKWEGSDE